MRRIEMQKSLYNRYKGRSAYLLSIKVQVGLDTMRQKGLQARRADHGQRVEGIPFLNH